MAICQPGIEELLKCGTCTQLCYLTLKIVCLSQHIFLPV